LNTSCRADLEIQPPPLFWAGIFPRTLNRVATFSPFLFLRASLPTPLISVPHFRLVPLPCLVRTPGAGCGRERSLFSASYSFTLQWVFLVWSSVCPSQVPPVLHVWTPPPSFNPGCLVPFFDLPLTPCAFFFLVRHPFSQVCALTQFFTGGQAFLLLVRLFPFFGFWAMKTLYFRFPVFFESNFPPAFFIVGPTSTHSAGPQRVSHPPSSGPGLIFLAGRAALKEGLWSLTMKPNIVMPERSPHFSMSLTSPLLLDPLLVRTLPAFCGC